MNKIKWDDFDQVSALAPNVIFQCISYIKQPLLLNLLKNNIIKINNYSYNLIFNRYIGKWNPHVAYLLNEYEKDENLIPYIVKNKQYCKLYFYNMDQLYSRIKEQLIREEVIRFVIKHRFDLNDTKTYIREDVLYYQKNKIDEMIFDGNSYVIDRDIGIELECISEKSIDFLAKNNNLINMVNKKDINTSFKAWAIKEDDSIITKKNPIEIISPIINYQSLKEELKELEIILKNNHFEVNETCGLHIHVDISDIYNLSEELLDGFMNFCYEKQEELYSLCNESRQNNIYCPKFIKINNIVSYPNNERNDSQRREGINLFTSYKTIEFRMKESILNFIEINDWINVCSTFINFMVSEYFYSEADQQKAEKAFNLAKDMYRKNYIHQKNI